MQQWRELLARHLALRNPTLTEDELNYAVQQTIDRIVFLRICEDRGIEHYGQLQELWTGDGVYERLKSLFTTADERYNSGLFHFRPEKGRREEPDRITPGLTVEDRPLKEIIGRLYYPDSPYEFRVLPADILGQVYEQFLGQVIRLTKGHRAKIEDKPEVRKAGGVYYTPTHIVDYIVGRTLGTLLAGKTPRQAARLKVLDPACGSGSFLISAYQFLLDWHLRYYLDDGAEKHKNELYQVAGEEWRLSTRERKRILLNSIYGVDIDSQAVEVTKLSLVLKVLEGETEETLNAQLRLFAERALPDLADNIKGGNSLVGTDVQTSLLPDEDYRKVNPFDWEGEFPAIMKGGGFDAVIGNPPYDVLEKERRASSWPHSALTKYVKITPEYEPALGGKTNLYRFFIVRSLRLTRIGGRYGMIVPLSLLADVSVASTRRHLMLSGRDLLVDCFPQKDNPKRRVFRKAKLSTCVVTCERVGRIPERSAKINVRVYPWNSFEDPYRESTIRLSDAVLLNPDNIPIPLTDAANWKVCKRVHSGSNVSRLGAVADFAITRGEINQTIYRRYITSDAKNSRLLKGVEVAPYHLNEELSQGEREWFDEARFLREHAVRPVVGKRRIATQRITGVDERLRVVATIIDPPCYFADSTNSIVVTDGSPYSPEYLLGLLNSTLYQWRFKLTSTNNNVGTNELEDMPFRLIDFTSESESALHDRMVGLVPRLFAACRALADARLGAERVTAARLIESLGRQIDKLVYELFDLKPAEVEVVEDLDLLPALTA